MEKEIKTNKKQETGVREIEVNLAPLLSAIFKKLWLIILGAIIGALIFQGYTRIFIKPTYLSSFTAFVNNKVQTNQEYVNPADLQASKDLVQTYSRILTSNNVLEGAAEFINLDIPYETLKNYVSTEVENNTQLIKVNVITNSATTSYKLAQAIANTAPAHMGQIVEGSSMKIVDAPNAPKGKYGPNYFAASLLGFLAGALLTLIYVLVRYFRDDTIKGEGDLEGRYSLPVIGVIPNLTETKNYAYGHNSYYESYEKAQKEANKKGGKN